MKIWSTPVIEELDINQTTKPNNGNNDTHNHKGWCSMHKSPELGICTCGVGAETGVGTEEGLS